eukprot:TRINITY_DN107_c1_g1_i3.p1 TRINITY_DN107_c1_g1~~TRINITY_DN107_c1_g1_i3.p1  ORF type:complete len:269 (-),score=-11.87 TRINITY_DN107_c1_g1_i3:364-1170(-)
MFLNNCLQDACGVFNLFIDTQLYMGLGAISYMHVFIYPCMTFNRSGVFNDVNCQRLQQSCICICIIFLIFPFLFQRIYFASTSFGFMLIVFNLLGLLKSGGYLGQTIQFYTISFGVALPNNKQQILYLQYSSIAIHQCITYLLFFESTLVLYRYIYIDILSGRDNTTYVAFITYYKSISFTSTLAVVQVYTQTYSINFDKERLESMNSQKLLSQLQIPNKMYCVWYFLTIHRFYHNNRINLWYVRIGVYGLEVLIIMFVVCVLHILYK